MESVEQQVADMLGQYLDRHPSNLRHIASQIVNVVKGWNDAKQRAEEK